MRTGMKNLLRTILICGCTVCGFGALTSATLTYAHAAETRGIYFEIDKNPIEKVTIKAESEKTEVQCGEKLALTAKVYPDNAAATIVSTTYRVVAGGGYAKVENGILSVSNEAIIGGKIEVVAVVDGVESENRLLFTVVRTPVERIELVSEASTIQLGGALLMQAQVYPENATEKYVTYSVVEGGRYAKISYNGVLTCNYDPSVEEGSQITVRVTSVSDPAVYGETTLTVHKPVLEVVEMTAELCGVEQQRTYQFTMDKEPYASIFGGKAVYYSLNVGEEIATIDLRGSLYVAPDAPIGTEFTVYIDAGDGTHYEQNLQIIPVYATAFAPVIVTPPSLQWNGKDYYLPGDSIQFTIQSFQPINVSDINKVCTLRVNDESLAYVDGDTVILKPAEGIKQREPRFVVTVYSEPNKLEQTFEIFMYIPVKEVAIQQKTADLRENTTYSLDELFSYTASPANCMPRATKIQMVGAEESIAEIKDNRLIVHDNLPAGEITFGIYVDIDGVRSQTIKFEVYKPTRTLQLSVQNKQPISAKDSADTVTLFTKVSETASVNRPVLRVTQGADYLASDIVYVGRMDNGLAKWQFVLKKDLAHYVPQGGLLPIFIEAEQDGITSDTLWLDVHIPNEELFTNSATVKRGDTYAIVFTHTQNASTTAVEWRIANAAETGAYKVAGSSNEIFIPKNLSAGKQVRVEYRSADSIYDEANRAWKVATYTVATISDRQSTCVYDSGVKADSGFSVVYGQDSGGAVIGKGQTLPQLMTGSSTVIEVVYRGQSLLANGMSIVSVKTNSIYGTVVAVNAESFEIRMRDDAPGNAEVKITITIQDGGTPYAVECGTLRAFRAMGGELSFKTITASGTNLKNYINESKSTFDKTANNGTGDLKFEILTTDEKEAKKISLSQAGVLTVKSYTAAKTHKIQYSYTATYNGAYSVPYEKTADITLQSVKVDNTGGSGTSYFISMTGMNSVSAKDDRPTRSGYKFIGYCSSKNDQGTKYINSAGARVNTSSFSSTIYAAWLKTSSVVSLTADNGNRDKTITDSDKYTEVIYPGMEREKLKAYGYTVLEITIKFDCKEKNDGYQDLWIYSHRDEQMGHTTFEHGSGYKDTNWGSHSVTYTLTLDNVQTDGSFWLRWGAHGNFGDDWVLGFTTITVTAK